MASETTGKNRVVVVGGGIAGALAAKSLQSDADVVLIDPKEYFEITWASMRAKVEPSVSERMVVKHKDYFTNGRLAMSSAVGVTETHVLTADGESIPYDYLVIATGHNDNVPKTRSERIEQYQADYNKIESADSILIIGGGPSGVELAGELAVDFPGKKVTLVHSRLRLLDFVGAKASKKALDWLTSRKVEVILDQLVDLKSHSDGDKTFKTSTGETIVADIHFFCVGKPLSSSWIKDSVLNEAVDARGRVMVDEHLRVKGRKNVFAIGDITDIPEMKQGYLAQKHALLAAKNVKLLMDGGKESKLASYKTGSDIAIISLGRKEAVAQFPFTTIVGCIPGLIKSKDLFIGKTRKTMGV
ncbi:hypothetical protein C5167_046934 [Papaver somniferum]|uniref:FAD/NAD(P)-binding domain-containing protein n=1 Tax=Papaver somniferum TaxID=3469 RepID=A0A4Y7LFZ5_PAPSO|nr:apoptosis-inducing factor homolog B-like [Papaver somniferum]RZC84146.1 hypothetical protein C5167_046934 [Papaver somniferum]